MNDSLLSELESKGNEEPLLRDDRNDVWAELSQEDNLRESSGVLDHTLTYLAAKSASFRKSASSMVKKGAGMRKGANGIEVASGGGNVPDSMGRVHCVEGFANSLYNYYQNKGFTYIWVSGAVNLLNLAFTIVLSTFLLGCVDWSSLAHCVEIEGGCGGPLSAYASCSANWGIYKVMIFFYFTMFTGFWGWHLIGYIATLRDSIEMHVFYRDRLKISSRRLQTMSWNDIVSRLQDLMEGHRGAYKLNLNGTKMSAHDLASRVMRRENYLIAFLNMNVIDLGILKSSAIGDRASKTFFARNMEWNLHLCILNYMFDQNFKLNPQFVMNVEGLQKRFVVAGIINFFMTPFVLLFMIIQFFLKYSQDWHSKRNYLGPRQWSPLALWRFREFNELPHVFEKRIASSYPVAQKYQDLFPTPIVSVIARGIAFFSGSLMAVLVVFSLVEEAIILEVHVYGRQLLWYLTVLTGIFAMARSFISSPGECNESPEEVMMQLSGHTHYFPSNWKGRCDTFDVRDEVYSLFQYKVQLFFQECISVILTPYILCFSLPHSAQPILQFIEKHTTTDDQLGSVCAYSTFNFKRYGNSKYGCPAGTNNQEASMHGKMEKSFINFKHNHPNWRDNNDGETMVNRIHSYKLQQESAAMEKSFASFAAHVPQPYQTNINMQEHLSANTPSSEEYSKGQESYSHHLMQSQAIQQALGMPPQENDFYWMEKFSQQTNTSSQL